jgi:hypothetical protein
MKEIYTVEIGLETPPAIIEKDNRRSDVVRQRLEQIDSSLTLTSFEQSDLWVEVDDNSYWLTWKFGSLKDYIKKSGITLSTSEVGYRVKESKYSKLLGITKTQRALAKISKLKVIYTLDPNATAIESGTGNEEKMSDVMIKLVIDAPNKTLKEIEKIVDQLKGVTEEEDDEMTWLNVRLRRDAKEVIMQAVTLIVAQSGSTIDIMTKEEKDISIGTAFERLAAEYLADPNNAQDEFEEGQDFEDSMDDSGGDDSQDDEDYDDDYNIHGPEEA